MAINLILQAELTRPADTTAYTIGDVITNSTSAPTLFTLLPTTSSYGSTTSSNGTGYITKIRVFSDNVNVSTASAIFRLHLYHSTVTATNDNAPMAVLYANRDKKIGVVDTIAFRTGTGSNTGAYTHNIIDRLPFTINNFSTYPIYCVIETLTGFTPASGQKFWVEVTADMN
jgi:hypothetical protein